MAEKKVYKPQGKPENAGSCVNDPNSDFYKIHKKGSDDNSDSIMADLLPLWRQAYTNMKRGGNWTPIELAEKIDDYFAYSLAHGLKPCKAGICVWLGISKQTYWAWETNDKGKYGSYSELIQLANMMCEIEYISSGQKYPTMNMFLLKSKHQYVEKQVVDVNNKTDLSTSDILAKVSKLNLNK